jgi:acetylornithine/succinyldiaminopimelate/putrescine aminotransferase
LLPLARRKDFPTAFITYNTLMASGAVRELEREGWSVPGDVSIASADVSPLATDSTPRITAAASPSFAGFVPAARLALRVTGRSKIVAIEHSFHGRTAAAGAVTWGAMGSWYGFPRAPMDVTFVPRNDVAALAAAVDSATAGVIIEPVQGLAGAFDFAPEFLHAARAACDRHGALLILDEVQTGIGRLGEPFGAQLYRVRPDLLTTAKGLGGGFPCGAILLPNTIAAELKPGALGTTFGGGPVACAAIKAVIEVINEDRLLANVREVSATIRATCRVGPVESIQGQGFLLGLKTRPRAALVRDALLERDILTGTSADPHMLRLLPPLILTIEHVQRLAAALEDLTDAPL